MREHLETGGEERTPSATHESDVLEHSPGQHDDIEALLGPHGRGRGGDRLDDGVVKACGDRPGGASVAHVGSHRGNHRRCVDLPAGDEPEVVLRAVVHVTLRDDLQVDRRLGLVGDGVAQADQ